MAAGALSPARADHDACRKAKLCGNTGQDGTDLLVALVDLRDLGAGKAAGLKHGLGPIAGTHVKQQSARGVRDVGVALGFVVAHPQDLGPDFCKPVL